MLKCIISTSIPSEWAPALCNADETGLICVSPAIIRRGGAARPNSLGNC